MSGFSGDDAGNPAAKSLDPRVRGGSEATRVQEPFPRSGNVRRQCALHCMSYRANAAETWQCNPLHSAGPGARRPQTS